MDYQEKLHLAVLHVRHMLEIFDDCDLMSSSIIPDAAAMFAENGEERYHLNNDVFDAFF